MRFVKNVAVIAAAVMLTLPLDGHELAWGQDAPASGTSPAVTVTPKTLPSAKPSSPDEGWSWEIVEAEGEPVARHEAALVAFDEKLYLIGGRRINPVSVYDPVTNEWSNKSKSPIELHHFQAVVWGKGIYLMGAMTGRYPKEKPVEKIVVYYPESDTFDFVHTIPETRRRGGSGAVVHGGKIYVAGGITNGHIDGTVAWLDEYDPATGDWTPLPDAPDARDHVSIAVAEGKLVFAAGRETNKDGKTPFSGVVAATNVFDLETRKWLPVDEESNIPTKRAGTMAFSWADQVIIGGGESLAQKSAHSEVEAFDIKSKRWNSWPSLKYGRHGSNFAIIGDYVYTASGCLNRGGKPESKLLERLRLPQREKARP